MFVYQSSRHPFSRYLRLSVDFEAEFKMTRSARANNKESFTLYCFFENKVHFYPIILVNTKTTISLMAKLVELTG